ncbi:MAG: diguanylate cyclase [Pusillimonas sp.]
MMGHAWTFKIRASNMLAARIDGRLPGVIAAAGVTLSAFFAVLTFMLLSAKSRAEAAARVMTKDLSLERRRLDAILDGARVGTWEWNVQTGETLFNEYWASIIGYTLAELQPVSIETWLKYAHPEDLAASQVVLEQHLAGKLAHYESEVRMRHKDGHWVWVLDRGKVAKRDDQGRPLLVCGTHQDISLEKQKLQALEHDVFHDPLTGLPNRKLLDEQVSQALALAARWRSGLVLMYLDLDGFKLINDEHGHDAGDAVLQTFADRMRACLRASDTLARVGGDEFVLLLQSVTDASEALAVARKLNEEACKPFDLPGGGVGRVSLSIGIALYPEHGATADELGRRADEAMYSVKKGAKNGVRVYGKDVS